MQINNMAEGAVDVEELESWEDLTDEILERNLAKMKAKAVPTKKASEEKQGPVSVVFEANDIRSRYLPSEPTVKILKRPSAGNNISSSNSPASGLTHSSHAAAGDGAGFVAMNGTGSDVTRGGGGGGGRKPMKTLQQREAEYAEARLRIMGEAQSPQEKQVAQPTFTERVRRIQSKPNPSPPLPAAYQLEHSPVNLHNHIMIATPQPQPTMLYHPHNLSTATTTILTTPTSFVDTTGCGSGIYHHATPPPPQAQWQMVTTIGGAGSPTILTGNKQQFVPNHVAGGGGGVSHVVVRSAQVIRQPRGPDGTRGFQFHQPR